MSKPHPHDAIHSLNMFQQIMHEVTDTGSGSCGGDCSNCPCSEESPKSAKKANDQETSDPCDKC